MSKRTGFTTITPYLVCNGASQAIDYYIEHLGAKELYRLEMDNGLIAHAEIEIGDGRILLSDEFEKLGILSPLSIGGSPISLNIYVDNPDAVFASLLKDAGIELSPMEDQFHGDRSGKLQDRYGHIWHIASNQHDLTSDEIVQKFKQAMGR